MEYKYIDSFSPRTRLSKESYDNVSARWEELGFEGKPPRISVFEDADFPQKI
jgi:hypothetical protein